ncbi:MAG TPA: nucleotidyltransferase family protein [Acidimicrobiales bacterium]|nr:nucleotidyltransferase family protein [Acidimicrobiales bacterium]
MSNVAALPLRALVEANREEIKAIVRRHKARAVALFGSVGRGDETPASDIDLLVEFEAGSSLFDLGDLQDELASLLGHRVDVVSVGGLKARDHRIRREARWL